jgi:hypothetical protein
MKLNSNLRLPCIVLGALALSSAALFAADAPKTQDERGTIKSVDATAHTLVVSDLKNKTEHKFVWNDQTKFTERGKTATAADLKIGERVRISYSGSGDLLTMQRVHIAPVKAEKPAAEKS